MSPYETRVVRRYPGRYQAAEERERPDWITGGMTWYELGHDRMIMPVLISNKDWWRPNNSQPWQISAYKWRRDGRPDFLLLSKVELKYAPASWSSNLTPDEGRLPQAIKGGSEKGELTQASSKRYWTGHRDSADRTVHHYPAGPQAITWLPA